MAYDETFRIGKGCMPARSGPLGVADGIPAKAADHGIGVARVSIDRYPAPWPGNPQPRAVPEVGSGKEAAGGKRVADRSRAVVAPRVPGFVAAAPDIGPSDDFVGGADRRLDRFRCARWGEGDATQQDGSAFRFLLFEPRDCPRGDDLPLRWRRREKEPFVPADAGGSEPAGVLLASGWASTLG